MKAFTIQSPTERSSFFPHSFVATSLNRRPAISRAKVPVSGGWKRLFDAGRVEEEEEEEEEGEKEEEEEEEEEEEGREAGTKVEVEVGRAGGWRRIEEDEEEDDEDKGATEVEGVTEADAAAGETSCETASTPLSDEFSRSRSKLCSRLGSCSLSERCSSLRIGVDSLSEAPPPSPLSSPSCSET